MSNTSGFDACNTLTKFFRGLDDRDYDTMASLLANDGVWHRQGRDLHGPTMMREELAKRSPTMVIHHLLTNVVLLSCTQTEAVVSAYMSVVRHDSGKERCGPAPSTNIENIRTLTARMRATQDGWRITDLGGAEPTFTRG
jgi:ketosteroid isomerase-like protein